MGAAAVPERDSNSYCSLHCEDCHGTFDSFNAGECYIWCHGNQGGTSAPTSFGLAIILNHDVRDGCLGSPTSGACTGVAALRGEFYNKKYIRTINVPTTVTCLSDGSNSCSLFTDDIFGIGTEFLDGDDLASLRNAYINRDMTSSAYPTTSTVYPDPMFYYRPFLRGGTYDYTSGAAGAICVPDPLIILH